MNRVGERILILILIVESKLSQKRTMESKEESKRPDREGNVINVSVNKKPNFYVFLGKKIFQEHETVELHALGNAVSICAIAAESLVK